MINTSQPAPMPMSTEPAPRLRLHYLDGLRGLAAIVVVLNHARLQSSYHGGDTAWQHIQFGFLQMISDGRAAVGVFIVLSGYCLMLPVVRSSDRTLRGGTLSFLKRRARRILPAYYCALGLILVMVTLLPSLKHSSIPQWRDAAPYFSPLGILSHLFLVHNLNPNWFFKIDPPAWTVATEWQIYFIFSALLLPLWKKYGNAGTIAVSFGIGLVPVFVLHHGQGASPWFLGLFALGMGASAIGLSPRPHPWKNRLPWGLLGLIFFACITALENLYIVPSFKSFTGGIPDGLYKHYWILDIFVGLATACALIFCTNSLTNPSSVTKPIILRVLECPAFVSAGIFSYSLYLVHDPLLAITCDFLQRFHLPPPQMFGALVVLGLPIALIGAYLFHLAFERRFMGAPKP